ncbi:MAG: hypothetical protein LBO73_00940 [Holosporaceae bacterium]|jgi:hypothetical protein|nr:hypothetical protein [Holosporaceae bacterium]
MKKKIIRMTLTALCCIGGSSSIYLPSVSADDGSIHPTLSAGSRTTRLKSSEIPAAAGKLTTAVAKTGAHTGAGVPTAAGKSTTTVTKTGAHTGAGANTDGSAESIPAADSANTLINLGNLTVDTAIKNYKKNIKEVEKFIEQILILNPSDDIKTKITNIRDILSTIIYIPHSNAYKALKEDHNKLKGDHEKLKESHGILKQHHDKHVVDKNTLLKNIIEIVRVIDNKGKETNLEEETKITLRKEIALPLLLSIKNTLRLDAINDEPQIIQDKMKEIVHEIGNRVNEIKAIPNVSTTPVAPGATPTTTTA